MRTTKILYVVLSLLVVVSLLPAITFAASDKVSTLDNLLAAFNGESNAHARYVAFAEKADKEGHPDVACLFRAAARAEKIHAGNHAAVIKKLGGEAKADIGKIEVKSTRENLEAALKGESYEKDIMYPTFLRQAKREKNADAMRTFNLAKTAEIGHAKLYSEALKNLSEKKNGAGKYYVCSVCGLTVTVVDFAKCPSCFSPKDKFESVL